LGFFTNPHNVITSENNRFNNVVPKIKLEYEYDTDLWQITNSTHTHFRFFPLPILPDCSFIVSLTIFSSSSLHLPHGEDTLLLYAQFVPDSHPK